MSLNGLDGAAVAEALQAAQADAGGWFLLKYVNRDTVEVLSKGTGGVPEVRALIQNYGEKSPLYGMVQYRRKKVVLKYVPDGTSRLLQVRLTVQFQSVLETFTPHDTVFSFAAASELTESALGLSTMLLPSAVSLASSSSSLRRRRLNEITEDAEEVTVLAEEENEEDVEKEKQQGQSRLALDFLPPQTDEAPLPQSPITAFGRRELDELPASAVLAKALLAKRKEEAAAAASALTGTPTSNAHSSQERDLHPPRKEGLLASPKLSTSPLPSPLPSIITDKALPATPEPTPPSTSEGEPPTAPDFDTTSNILLGATAATAAESSSQTTPRPHTRHLSAAESDSISQWSSNVTSYATAKPKKKKRGPRPHVEPTGRPKTSGTIDSSTGIRPVANLPTSIRVNNKSLVSLGLRPGSQQSTRSVPGRFATSSQSTNGAPPLPSPSFLRAPYSPSDSRSAILGPASVTGDAYTATPEKVRLMKALQLRKRNMLLAQRASALSSTQSDVHSQNASEASLSTDTSSTRLSSIPSQEQLSNLDEETKLTHSSYTTSPTTMTYISEEPSTKASSFSEHANTPHSRRSLSSATSSSLTPKAPAEDEKAGAESTRSACIRPSSISTTSIAAIETEDDPHADVKVALAYLEAVPDKEPDTCVMEIRPQQSSEARRAIPVVTSATQHSSPRKSRRLAPPEPLKLRPNSHASTSDLSDDDSLMDEIHTATVHEAKPISVARSPVTPIMSKGSSDRLREVVNKPPTTSHSTTGRSAATTPERGRSASGSVRSVSTALPQWPPLPAEPISAPLTKKATLGTGISKRIKALEVLRTKDVSPPRQPVRETSAGTSAFSTFMKRSSLLSNQQQTLNASTDNSPPKALPTTGPQYDPHSSLAGREIQRPSVDVHRASQKGETISVTARIVRDQNSKHPPQAPSSNYHAPLNLHKSPLIVEHEKHDPASDRSLAANQPRVKSPTKSDRGRFSFSSHRSNSHTNLPRSSSDHSKVSKSGNHKRHVTLSVSDAASIGDDKAKTSMTSRLMKRMSNFTTSRNRNQSPAKGQSHQSQPSQDYQDLPRENSIADSLLHVVDIGDVNVQFPESFLWKRRFMRIDDQGYLIFSQPATESNMKSVSRKYHLGDFKRPTLPDYEREEMAWSVILDLKDGRCIQCACESKQFQQQVLQMLVDAHSAYLQLYGAR
ncbi:hypothetical protein A1O7_08631 [Cladophialophora yegresii CBS 114405]|uniref:ADF-H domain-containing protein n=1 Tax=Cladophialophora yegresii CBS 114405 TaxID=1182544 RepID=W9VJ41_9EURO|nr:uncharacterized protein A1O7_08631 [Cladophialophora yegresii CBS 114405]EXJ55702.1 hypothetical protein A1O7_08631 [Cladophialophora yegresii CBS 114405]